MNKFHEFIQKSWTYARLTIPERNRLVQILEDTNDRGPYAEKDKGTEQRRWRVANAIYTAFLYGCGYDGSDDWRDFSN